MTEIHIREVLPAEPVDGWVLPQVPGRFFAPLTNLIPLIKEFQEALCPRSRVALTRLNRAIAQVGPTKRLGDSVSRAEYSHIALAVDRGVLFQHGGAIAEQPLAKLEQLASPEAENLARVLRTFTPSLPTSPLSDATIGWLHLIGRLDPVVRGLRPLSDIDSSDLSPGATPPDIEKWLAFRVTPEVVDDVNVLLERALRLQPSGPFYPNPVFGGLGPIRGSDGDWIAGETLVELKCTVAPVKREYVVQMFCYAALARLPGNAGRLPPFGRLALMLPRQDAVVTGTIEEWLGAFGAPPERATLDCILDAFERRWREGEWSLHG